MESPSGRAWDVIRNRWRSLIASQSCASTESVRVGVIVSGVGMPRGTLRFEVLENLLDAIVARDGVVVEELEVRHAPEPQPAAELAPQERRGALQRPGAFTLRPLVSHRRVIDARELKIRRDAHFRQRQEPDARIVHVAGEELGELAADLVADARGARRHTNDECCMLNDEVKMLNTRRS